MREAAVAHPSLFLHPTGLGTALYEEIGKPGVGT